MLTTILRLALRAVLLGGIIVMTISIDRSDWNYVNAVYAPSNTTSGVTAATYEYNFGIWKAHACLSATLNSSTSFQRCESTSTAAVFDTSGSGEMWDLLIRTRFVEANAIKIPSDLPAWQSHAVVAIVVGWITSLAVMLDWSNRRSSEAWNAVILTLFTLFGILCAQVLRINRVSFAPILNTWLKVRTGGEINSEWAHLVKDQLGRTLYLTGGIVTACALGITAAWDRFRQTSIKAL